MCHVSQAQLVVLSAQIAWSENVETALSSMGGSGDAAPLHSVLSNVEVTLNVLADSVLMEQPPLRRRKLEHLVSPPPPDQAPLPSPQAAKRTQAREISSLASGRKASRWPVDKCWVVLGALFLLKGNLGEQEPNARPPGTEVTPGTERDSPPSGFSRSRACLPRAPSGGVPVSLVTLPLGWHHPVQQTDS